MGLFKIDKKIGSINYKFKLLKTIEIYPIFYISLLEPVLLGIPIIPVTEIQKLDPQKEYEVETVLDYQYIRGKIKYLIKWEGYPQSENTWEPKGNLNCSQKLEEFYYRNPNLSRIYYYREGPIQVSPLTRR